MRITTKGQVTIPKSIREKAGLVAGNEVEFAYDRGRVYLKKVKGEGPGRQLVERLRGQATVRMSTDEIMALTRGGKR
jgi:AbrB family looped-hinge helix DNA binding protein